MTLDDVMRELRQLQREVAARPVRLPAPATSGIWRAQVTAIGDNTLTCEIDGVEITVARPERQRRTHYEGGGTYTYSTAQARTASGDTEQITEAYVVGDYVYVARVANGTGVDGADWIDINSDGRAWAEDIPA